MVISLGSAKPGAKAPGFMPMPLRGRNNAMGGVKDESIDIVVAFSQCEESLSEIAPALPALTPAPVLNRA